jgi:hypothetical protein
MEATRPDTLVLLIGEHLLQLVAPNSSISLEQDPPYNLSLLRSSRIGRLPISKFEYWYERFINESTLGKILEPN